MKTCIYKEKQNFTLVWVITLVLLAVFIVLTFSTQNLSNENGENVPMGLLYFNLILVGSIFLLFYDMKILLNEKELQIRFGLGLFKRTFLLKDIDSQSIKIDKPKKINGIGWRYSLKGDMIFNTKFGQSVCFRMKDKRKTYHIVTSNYEELKVKLENICNL